MNSTKSNAEENCTLFFFIFTPSQFPNYLLSDEIVVTI